MFAGNFELVVWLQERALGGHWRAFSEGIRGALGGIGGHWGALGIFRAKRLQTKRRSYGVCETTAFAKQKGELLEFMAPLEATVACSKKTENLRRAENIIIL